MVEEVFRWLSGWLSSTHALVLAVGTSLATLVRWCRRTYVKAQLSDVREETNQELRKEITYLRADVEYYRSHAHGGTDESELPKPKPVNIASARSRSRSSAPRDSTSRK